MAQLVHWLLTIKSSHPSLPSMFRPLPFLLPCRTLIAAPRRNTESLFIFHSIYQSAVTMSTARKLTDAIKEDHQEMYEYHEQFNKAKGDVDAQTRWARQLTWEIARHAVGEEIIVYPLMEKHLGQHGLDLANQDRKDHLTVKTLLSKLESLQPGTAPYDQTVSEIMRHLHEHNDSEEINDLPILEAKIGAEGSEAAAASFTRTKKFAPTRAHPGAPDRPPYETLSAFITTPIDKLKDMFAKFPTEEMKQDAK